MSPSAYEIFASYSHHDARFVKPMIQYLRPTGATVFRDEDAIAPGKRWAAVVTEAIARCRVLYLFWCEHASASDEVRGEYGQAMGLEKDIVPVLLDDTPLPDALKAFQWVDLRLVVGRHEETVEQTIPLEEGLKRQRLDREAHGYRPGEDGYFAGNLARAGWSQQGDRYVRRIRVEKPVPDTAIRQAAVLLSVNLEERMTAR